MKQRPTTAKPALNAREIKEMRELDSAQYQTIGSNLSHFVILNELGKGSYGLVYKVRSTQDNNIYVLKKINLTHLKPKHQAEALKEAQLLRKLKHPNIITYYMSFIEQENLCIIMEYAEGGDLQRFLKEFKERRKYLPEEMIWEIGKELASAIQHLHDNNIIHRDIKALNVFLTKDRKVKLGDLGVSKIFNSETAMQGTRVGTPLYLAPELVQHQPYDFKVDVWALGCVIFYMAALEPPFQGENLIALGYSIVNRAPKALPHQYSQRMSQFIWKLLEKMPCLRPSISEVNNTYFQTKSQHISRQPPIQVQQLPQRPQTSQVRMQQQDTERLKKTRKLQQNEQEIEDNRSETICIGEQKQDQTQRNETDDRQFQKIQQYQQMIKEQQEKIERERQERERIERERFEKEKLDREKQEIERLERERQDRIEAVRRAVSERPSTAQQTQKPAQHALQQQLSQYQVQQQQQQQQYFQQQQPIQVQPAQFQGSPIQQQHRLLKIQQNEVELFIQDLDERRNSILSDNKVRLDLKSKIPMQIKGSLQIRPLSAQARGSSYASLQCKAKLLPVNVNSSVKEVKKFTIFDLKGTDLQPESQQPQEDNKNPYQLNLERIEPVESVHANNGHASNSNNAPSTQLKSKDNVRIKSAFILQYSQQNKKTVNNTPQPHVKHYTLKDLVD